MATTKYLWDDETDTVVMEKDGTNTTKAVYHSDPVPYGRLFSMRRDDKTYNYRYDAQGNTRALTDETGKTTDTYSYTAFGTPRTTTGTTKNPYRYGGQVGYQYNESSGDYYIRARTYQPDTSRWLSKDPLRFMDGMNAHVYVTNAPIGTWDASGLFTVSSSHRDKSQTIKSSLLCSIPNINSQDREKKFPFLSFGSKQLTATFRLDKGELNKIINSSGLPASKLGFVQRVTNEVKIEFNVLTRGGSLTTEGCRKGFGTSCACSSGYYTLLFQSEFTETFAQFSNAAGLTVQDGQGIRFNPFYAQKLSAHCKSVAGSDKLERVNFCCPWKYSQKITKEVTIGKSTGIAKSYDLHNSGKITCGNYSDYLYNDDKFFNIGGFLGEIPERGKPDIVSFPNTKDAYASIKKSTRSIEMSADKCGTTTISVTFQPYK